MSFVIIFLLCVFVGIGIFFGKNVVSRIKGRQAQNRLSTSLVSTNRKTYDFFSVSSMKYKVGVIFLVLVTILFVWTYIVGHTTPSITDSGESWGMHGTVDLGLSVEWADCNIGASKPYMIGSYFRWGEIHAISPNTPYLLYDYEGPSRLEKINDAAVSMWQNGWRLPTVNEMQELVNKCNWEWVNRFYYKGYIVTGPNGNSIFLPATGFYDFEVQGTDMGYYWTSDLNKEDRMCGQALCFSDLHHVFFPNDIERIYGRAIRPVHDTGNFELLETSALDISDNTTDTEENIPSCEPDANLQPGNSEANVSESLVTHSTSSSKSGIYTVNGVSFRMISVDGGTFQMGNPMNKATSSECILHSVTLSDFQIAETEVTQALWQAVMGSNPSHFKGDNNPVEQVSWDDCQVFINKLNIMTGEQFRLPTEAEWEFAAKGGNLGQGYKYSGSDNFDIIGWSGKNANRSTHAVKTKQANELGIYDMSGNVNEWCQDFYGLYSREPQINPKGPSSGESRIYRGGDYVSYSMVTNRHYWKPQTPFGLYGWIHFVIGLRLAL